MDKASFFKAASEFILANGSGADELPPDTVVPTDGNLFDLGLVTSYSMLRLVSFVEELSGQEIDILNSDISRLFTLEGIYDAAFGTA